MNLLLNLLLLAVAMFAVTGPLSGCGGAEGGRANHIARGQKYLAEGKLGKARVEFADALQISPGDSEGRYLSGLVMERSGDLRAAASFYQGTIDVEPGHVQARARLARLYLLSRSPDKALELVKPALAGHPEDPDLLTVRAVARAQLTDRAGALADAERATQLAPTNEDAVAALANLYRDAGQTRRAVELLDSAVRRTPDSVALHEMLAAMYLASGDEKRAEQQLVGLVQRRPHALPPRLELAGFYVRTRRLDDAERTLKAATAALPGSLDAQLAYVEFLTRNRAPMQGEAALRDLITHDPGNHDLQLRLGDLQQRADHTPEALATYRAVAAADPQGATGIAARNRIAAIDVATGQYVEARTLLAEVLRSSPHDDDALTLRANLSLKAGDPVTAITDLRAVLHDEPQNIPVLRTLARAHLANHETTLAEENLRSALAAAPQDSGVRIDLAELLRRTQRAAEAVALLEETVRATPDRSGTAARAALIEAYLAKPDLSSARRAVEDLKTLQPELASTWYLAGVVAQQQSRTADAQREFAHALQLQPSDSAALGALARLRFEHGQHAQAIALVQEAIERNPDGAATRNLLGELYLADGRAGDAVHAFQDAVRLAPNWWIAYGNLARARFAARDEAGGQAAYETGVKVTGEPLLVVALASFYEQRGRYEDAIREYEVLHARSPQLELAANNLAMLLVTYRSDQASLDRARDLTAAFANSDVGALLDTHGWVMLKRGDVGQALSALQRAATEAPNSKVILYHLGMAQLKAGLPDEARASLEAALAGGTSFTGTDEARLTLAQLKGRTG